MTIFNSYVQLPENSLFVLHMLFLTFDHTHLLLDSAKKP